MAFYHDFTVEDSYSRINRSLNETKVEDRLKNVETYKGKAWYDMPNARGTEAIDTFPSFFGTREIDHGYQLPTVIDRRKMFNTVEKTESSSTTSTNYKRPDGGNVGLQRHGALTPINPEDLQHTKVKHEVI